MLPAKQSKPNIKPVPEGFLLTETNTNPNFKLIRGLISNFTQTLIVFVLFSQFMALIWRSQITNLFVVRLIVVFLAIIVLAWFFSLAKSIYITLDQLLVSLSFNPPELIFTNYPLSLGEDVSILFRRRRRSGKIIPTAGTVNAKLTCNEDVIYSDDDSYAFATEQVINYQLPEILIPAYESAIEIIFNVKILPTAPPTFEAKNNQITWILEVSVDIPKLLKETSRFYIHIQPRLMTSNNQL
jgi:hypothetical protein